MDSKLHVPKALKVVDLKDILAKANVSVTGKANKPDLIAKILASPEAVEVYNQNYGPAPETPAQDASPTPVNAPQKSEAVRPSFLSSSLRSTILSRRVSGTTTEIDCALVDFTNREGVGSLSALLEACFQGSTQTSKRHSLCAWACRNDTLVSKNDSAAAATKPSEISATEDAKKTVEDEEAEKRKARAARFGIPVVEPKAANVKAPGKGTGKAKGASLAEDPDKLAARAARFGNTLSPQDNSPKSNGKKRSAEPVDEEELARRKKRAERFGSSAVGY
ncbi:hypothetical protein C8Q80DRAFT_1272440 [Daedaleopsis nitida]|nr:hypothetical protein C8Q80DRAFT_1272440 [Daedaleopsis nitida]